MGNGDGEVGGGGGERAYTEVCGSSTEVHERAPGVRKYMSLLSRGSSLRAADRRRIA